MEDNKKQYPTQVMLTIRAIVGAYVLYQSYQILTSGDEKSVVMYLLTGVLIIGGALILGMAIKQFVKGEYEGGKADLAQGDGEADMSVNTQAEDESDSDGVIGEIEEITDAEIVDEGNSISKALDFSGVSSIETVKSSDIENLD